MAVTSKMQDSGNTHSNQVDSEPHAAGGMVKSVKTGARYNSVVDQDFHRLMEAFTSEIRLAVPCDGIKYRADSMNQNFVSGVLDHYLCCFQIRVVDKSFGNIYFARKTQFLDSELKLLENMVAGLVMPLCRLFQVKVLQDNTRTGESDARTASVSSTTSHPPSGG